MGVIMEDINLYDIERKIAYWQHTLSKIESDMLKLQSTRVDAKLRLLHLKRLQTQVESNVETIVA